VPVTAMGYFVTVVVLVVLLICRSTEPKKIERFQVIWSAPSETCIRKFNVTIPLKPFGIKYNRNQTFHGNHVVLYYASKLGLYPYVDDDGKGEIINGGIPQVCELIDMITLLIQGGAKVTAHV
jgi:hypothetical protein